MFMLDAYNGRPMTVAGWDHPVLIDGAGVKQAADALPIYLTHDQIPDNLVGQTERIETSPAGKITASGPLTASRESSPAYARLLDHAANGYRWQASVGASVQESEFVLEGKTASANGGLHNGPLYIARQTTFNHIAIVALGADASTTATIAAATSGQEKPTMKFEQWIIAQGFVAADLSDEKKTSLQAAYDGLKAAGTLPDEKPVVAAAPVPTPAPAVDPTIAASRAAHAAELDRIAVVQTVTAGNATLAAQAVREGWTGEKAELEMLRASRAPSQSGPAVIGGSQPAVSSRTLEAAICTTARIPGIEKSFTDAELSAANRIGRIGLQESIMLAAQANGWTGRIAPSTFREQHRAILGAAFRNLNAGFSTVDIAGILSNAANKALLASFTAVEGSWRAISKIVPTGDFKTSTRYRLTSGGEYAKVAPDGELTHGTLGEETYTNKADTYGKILVITRQDQINDDLGALLQIPSQLGGDAGRQLNTVFWTAFEDNATFFSVAHANLVSAASAPWYLCANPSELAAMEVTFLDGREAPIVESAEADWNTLGIQMRSYHDFGCAKAEYRAGVKSTAALSLTSLEAALKVFNDQTIDGTHPVALQAAILLVGTGNLVTANNVFEAQEIRDTTASTKAPTANVFRGMFRPIMSRYLANA